MNRCLLRWILVILMGLALALLLSSPYMAEAELVVESGTLSMNILEGGIPPKEENWTFQPDLEDEAVTHPQSYRDSTIEVTFEQDFLYELAIRVITLRTLHKVCNLMQRRFN